MALLSRTLIVIVVMESAHRVLRTDYMEIKYAKDQAGTGATEG
jgi:hypothetical protein